VVAALGKIISNTISLDGNPLVFLKLLLLLILPVFTELFNYILTFSTFPLVWKISGVVPFPKVYSPTEKSDYRPISILPVYSTYRLLKMLCTSRCQTKSAAMVVFRHFSLVLDLGICYCKGFR
jgi:hypothetical protein